MHYGVHNSRLSPKAYTLSFITSDFIALVLQSAGGAIADTAATHAAQNMGVHIMVAGLSFQVVSLIVFMVLCSEFFWKVKKDRDSGRADRGETSLKMFLIGKIPFLPPPFPFSTISSGIRTNKPQASQQQPS